jgi:hypothetical protein
MRGEYVRRRDFFLHYHDSHQLDHFVFEIFERFPILGLSRVSDFFEVVHQVPILPVLDDDCFDDKLHVPMLSVLNDSIFDDALS